MRKMTLNEATMLALHGKLNEQKRNPKWTYEYIKKDLLQQSDKLDEEVWEAFTKFFREEKGYEDWTDDEINLSLNEDDIKEFWEYLNEEDDDENLEEARNPENDEINTKIRKTLNGSDKYVDDIEKAGLEVTKTDDGKVDMIRNPKMQKGGYKGMRKKDLKNAHPDTDYYNYMMKDKVEPEVTDTGDFTPTNPFRNSDNFEKTIGGHDTTYRQTDRNGVSNAIPKRYKTGRSNTGYDPDKFPKKDYQGVASYEPLKDDTLADFKWHKTKLDLQKQDLDKVKAEYDKVKADYDETDKSLKSVRDRIAKSRERVANNKKTESKNCKDEKCIDGKCTLKMSTKKKTEDLIDMGDMRDSIDLGEAGLTPYKITISSGEEESSFEFLADEAKTFEEVCDEIYGYIMF